MLANTSAKNDVIAIIPARSGSKGVIGKNVCLLAGYPLVAYSIVAAKMTKTIGRVIVSTDSEEIAEICKKFGAEVPFLRPAEYSGDQSQDIEFVLHAIDWFQNNEKAVPEYLVHLRPTTPLRAPHIIDVAIRKIYDDREASSLRSGHPAAESPFKWFQMSEKGYFKGIRPQDSNEDLNLPRQAFPQVYIPDGYVDVLKTSFIRKTGIMYGERMLGFISPICKEVDTIEDFEHLEYEIKRKDSPLLDYLNKMRRR